MLPAGEGVSVGVGLLIAVALMVGMTVGAGGISVRHPANIKLITTT
jgi:hypothetical protein